MQKSRIIKVLVSIIVLFVLFPGADAFAIKYTVTPGVEYSKGPTTWNSKAQSIHTVEVDVGRPEISVEAMIPSPLTSRYPLTNILQRSSYTGHHVVAGINASFFHMNSGAPAYLLASDNIVNTYGVISTGNDEYMSVPSAFGIDREGKGRIGTFGYEAAILTADGMKKINSINKTRGIAEIVLYTPSYSYSSTRTNSVGMEIVLTGLSSSIEENYRLGTPVTAKVERVVKDNGDSTIPANGAILSIQGGALASEFANVKVGDELTLSVDLTEPWKEADFVLASGPLLVQNGKVDMTINPNSSRANSREPRTAVAVNADGTKVFLVTVDGRQTNSLGMTLVEFADYLVSLGAYGALNLDGGGSTTMAVRERGKEYPQLFNTPSDKFQRYVSAVLGAVSYTEIGAARTLNATLSGPSLLLRGATTAIQLNGALDVNFHVVPIDKNEITYSVTGDIGTVSSEGVFTATNEGTGAITVSYENATTSFPLEVVEAPASMTITGGASGEIAPEDSVKFTVKAFDARGREMAFPSTLVNFTVTPELGTIDSSGVLTTNHSGEGSVTATIGTKSATQQLMIINEGRLITSFENSTEWQAESARASTTLRFDGNKAPYKDEATALTLAYDFTENPTGVSASYAVSKKPLVIPTKPTALGLWVFGDGASHWLRGSLTDANGKELIVDFTQENGLSWTGWKYVKAQIPTSVQGPVSLKRIYIAETSSAKKNKGSIYLDKLIAEYGNSHKEKLFNDVELDYWGIGEISGAVNQGWINGYPDGSFKPENSLTRAHAALLLSRALKLPLEPVTTDLFTDVSAEHQYAREIAAINKKGIMTGKAGGETFDPEGTLTRAQMAKMLVIAYSLTHGDTVVPEMSDVDSKFWAFEQIQILQANEITVVPDGKFRPNDSVKRSQFAAFMTRAKK